jgi:hypothetical protein
VKAVRQTAPRGAAPAHRHTLGPEHDHEPQHGLPELLPADETLLWQGSPDWRALALRAFHLRKIALYFGALMALRGVVHAADGAPLSAALQAALAPLPLALAGLGLLAMLAWLSARATVYTLTDRRVVMRIGIVLTVTYNLPFKRIAAAALQRSHDGHGDIALTLAGRDRIAWLQLWPHVRPWHLRRPEPTLRAVADAERVASLLSQAWSAAQGQAVAAPGRETATSVASPAATEPRTRDRGNAPAWQPQ